MNKTTNINDNSNKQVVQNECKGRTGMTNEITTTGSTTNQGTSMNIVKTDTPQPLATGNTNPPIKIIVHSPNPTKIPLPGGTYNGVCVGVFFLGYQPGYQGGAPREELALVFEVDRKISDGKLVGQPYRLAKRLTASLHEKSNLSKVLRQWFDASPVTMENGAPTFDPAVLIGRPCTLSVGQKTRADGTVRAEILSISKHIDGMPILVPVMRPDETPEWVKKAQDEAIKL